MPPAAGFAQIYSQAAGDDNEKLHAVAAEFDRLRAAQLSATEVNRAFAAAMETGQSKVQLANNKLDELAAELTSALLPALVELSPAIEAMTPAISSAISQFARLLGIDANADADARKKRAAADAEQAMRDELAKAQDQTPTLTRGKDGAQLKPGEIDESHVKVIEGLNTKAGSDLKGARGRLRAESGGPEGAPRRADAQRQGHRRGLGQQRLRRAVLEAVHDRREDGAGAVADQRAEDRTEPDESRSSPTCTRPSRAAW